jgi:hypothetical protein
LGRDPAAIVRPVVAFGQEGLQPSSLDNPASPAEPLNLNRWEWFRILRDSVPRAEIKPKARQIVCSSAMSPIHELLCQSLGIVSTCGSPRSSCPCRDLTLPRKRQVAR